MAVVDFRPRYAEGSNWDIRRFLDVSAYKPLIVWEKSDTRAVIRFVAHFALCSALTLFTIQVLLGVDRIQAYLAPFNG